MPAGIIRCNETNPCTGFVLDNVKVHGWWRLLHKGYITENVEGTVKDSKPIPEFGGDGDITEVEEPDDIVDSFTSAAYSWIESVLLGQLTALIYDSSGQAILKAFKAAVELFGTTYKQMAFI